MALKGAIHEHSSKPQVTMSGGVLSEPLDSEVPSEHLQRNSVVTPTLSNHSVVPEFRYSKQLIKMMPFKLTTLFNLSHFENGSDVTTYFIRYFM